MPPVFTPRPAALRAALHTLVAVIVSVLLHSSSPGQARYSVVGLGSFEDTTVYVNAINDSGVIAGTMFNTLSADNIAFLWRNGVFEFPGTLGGPESGAADINNLGLAVGFADIADFTPNAISYSNGSMASIGTLGSGRQSFANAVNDLGQVVGLSAIVDTIPYLGLSRAFLFSGGALTDLGALGGPTSMATGINNSGVIVGNSLLADEVTTQAFVHRNGSMSGLGALGTDPSNNSMAFAINDSGMIVGSSQVDGGEWHPFTYKDGVMTDLGFAGTADDINNRGEIVGTDQTTYVGFLYRDGVATDLNSLIDPASGWTISEAYAINNRGQIAGLGYLNDVYQAFMMTPTGLQVTSPGQDELWIAGERDTIRWSAAGVDSIDIYIALDADTSGAGTYEPVVLSWPADSGRYPIDLPGEFMSRKCRIKIVNSSDPADTALSAQFRIKGYVLTRVGPGGQYEAFRPDLHGWGFRNSGNVIWPPAWWQQFNYQAGTDPFTGLPYPSHRDFNDAPEWTFPDWPTFVGAFGLTQCYTSDPPVWYWPSAVVKWASVRRVWGGSCAGMTGTALLDFEREQEFLTAFSSIPPYLNLFDLDISAEVRNAVNVVHVRSNYGREQVSYRHQQAAARTPMGTVEEVKQMLLSDGVDLRDLTVNYGGGHAIIPYAVERDPLVDGAYHIYVYDPNGPGDSLRTVDVDSASGTWTFQPLGWSYNRALYLQAPVSTLLQEPILGKTGQPAPAATEGGSASQVELYVSGGPECRIEAAGGGVAGFDGSALIDSLADASPIFSLSSAEIPPVGYVLPIDGYRLTLSGVDTSARRVTFFADSAVYTWALGGGAPAGTDILAIGGGISVRNPDTTLKSALLAGILRRDTVEMEFSFSEVPMSPGDSMGISAGDGDRALLVNGGGPAAYRLSLWFASPAGERRFDRPGITIAAQSTHRIAPDWNDLSVVAVLMDSGSDGSIDDTLLVSNQLTGVEGAGPGLLPPAFALRPNYPNPFNPSTTVRYEVPERSPVSLKVFDVLGREVATLVDRVEEPGPKQIVWEAGDRPAGVYYLRMVAGGYSATEKMLLVR